MSTFSTDSLSSDTQNAESKTDLECLMEAVKREHMDLSNQAQKAPRNIAPCHSTSHTKNMAARLNPVTPTKPKDDTAEVDPLTPTANMKLLMSAVSPEIRNREKEQRQTKKQELTVETNNSYMKTVSQKGTKRKASQSNDDEEEDTQTSGRKEKSLGLLCQRY